MPNEVDIKENDIYAISPELLNTLLRDNTLSTPEKQVNIFWATDNYASLGPGYQYFDTIQCEAITGIHGDVIKPRSQKCREQQQQRVRQMAEVFTPSWMCNKQINMIDESWFRRSNVFNTEVDEGGKHTWIPTEGKIDFTGAQWTWQEYISENRLEMTCGEAPYLASRYDAVTGDPIPLHRRIGMLDRKMRIVNEHTNKSTWLKWAIKAFKGTYGYEWQGDNLLLARESLLYTFIEYYTNKFKGEMPDKDLLQQVAEIIAWNIWQMDGLKSVIPCSCVKAPKPKPQTSQMELFDEEDFNERKLRKPLRERSVFECPGCAKRGMAGMREHTGIYAKIMDWELNTPIEFVTLFKETL